MPKSKEFVDDSDSEEVKKSANNDSGSDEEAAKPVASKKSKAKTSDSKNDPPAKRTKTTDESGDGDAVASSTGSNGERLYEIGKLRFVSVSEFRNKPYINIREYYDDKGVQKPGKKGISLTVEQWDKLKTLINQVDKELKKSK